jgi:aspartyl-tRNA(Asn)/glutamyl-tRNA(Gln) amidotransferase subunit C
MKIDEKTVADLAKLARLDLRPEEAPVFAAQLPKIIDYVGQLQKVSTTVTPEVILPTDHWREDQVEPSAMAEDILKQAPDRADHFWRVPPVL